MITGIMYAIAVMCGSAALFCASYCWISGGSILACIVGSLACVVVAVVAFILLLASFVSRDVAEDCEHASE